MFAVDRSSPIISVSLGARRLFRVAPTVRGTRGDVHSKARGNTLSISLSLGDILIMTGDMQEHFQHSLPNSTNDEPRISITWRSHNKAPPGIALPTLTASVGRRIRSDLPPICTLEPGQKRHRKKKLRDGDQCTSALRRSPSITMASCSSLCCAG